MTGPRAVIFADGSCGPRQDVGAWAAVACFGESHRVAYGSEFPTTVTRCELLPVIAGLRLVKAEWARSYPSLAVTVISDSEVTVRTLSGEFPRMKHQELWAAADEAARDLPVRYVWRERNTLPHMTFCDELCKAVRASVIATIKAGAEAYRDIEKFDGLPAVDVVSEYGL